jgi:PKD repeat protein
MSEWRKHALAGVMLLVCVSARNAAAQTPRLLWDGDGSSIVTGYAVTIDGVRTDHRLTPLSTNGTCGCSIPVPFSGGRHTIVVSAYNAAGERPSAPLTVGPSASAGGPYSGVAGLAIAVTGAASNAPTGSLTRYSWRWGDGSADTVSTTAASSHVYASNGTYTITLTVTDNAGATATSTTTATISSGTTPLPAPWQTQDVGSVGSTGSASFANGRFTVAGAGADIWGTQDGFRYVYQPLAGDGQIVARVTTIQNTHGAAKAGVMIRESLNNNAANALVNVTPGGGIELLVRSSGGGATSFVAGATQALPAWLKLARTGSNIVASISADGSAWSVVGTRSVSMSANVLVGLAVTSHNYSVLNTSSFDNVSVTSSSTTQPPATPSSPTPSNGATAVSTTASLTWSAGGATSYDVSFGTANPPPQVATGVTASTYRPSSMANATTYYWRVVARGPGGASTGPVWSFTTAPASTGGAIPAPWTNRDIGSVGRAGSASFSSGTFTVAGSGADIWGSVDSFHYVYQPLTGNGQIVARVLTMQNTHNYAKAGVMVRGSLDANAAQAIMNSNPGGGVEFLSRAGQGQSTRVVGTATQSRPAWMKLVRSGSTLTGSVSRDGSSWTQVGSTTISMNTTVYVGLAVTSHDTSLVNTATFDSVTLTAGGTTPPPPTTTGDVVIYGSDVPSTGRHGMWQTASDSLSPGGVKLVTANTGFASTSAALASPTHYFDVTFSADAGTPYRIWLRLRASQDSKYNDAVWVQFSDALVNGSAAYRMNSTSGLLVNLATDAAAGSLQNWGWVNGAYWLTQPTVVTFPTSGVHTLRVQLREDGVQLDQIVLSPARYMNASPGSATNDTVIVPKN